MITFPQRLKYCTTSEEKVPFKSLGISARRLQILHTKGIQDAFPIQHHSFKHLTAGEDFLGRARTGTGKTIAFCLPLIEKYFPPDVAYARNITVVIMEPTRELALQVQRELQSLDPNIKTLACYGGTSIITQINELRKGVHIVIGTPGRMNDLLERGELNFTTVKCVVLDEADHMLDIGFKEDIETLLNALPTTRQTVFFSATVPSWVNEIAKKHTKNMVKVDLIGSAQKTNQNVTHYYIEAPEHNRLEMIENLIRKHTQDRAIIFTKTKVECSELSSNLTIEARALHGDISQNVREVTLQGFREGKFPVLVATDVAARGLDIPEVDLVIQYNTPQDFDSYVHRSGRCGRAGRKGVAIIFTKPQERSLISQLSRILSTNIQPMNPPSSRDSLGIKLQDVINKSEAMPLYLAYDFNNFAKEIVDQKQYEKLSKILAVACGYRPKPSSSLLTSKINFVTIQIESNANSVSKIKDMVSTLNLHNRPSDFIISEDSKHVYFDCTADEAVSAVEQIKLLQPEREVTIAHELIGCPFIKTFSNDNFYSSSEGGRKIFGDRSSSSYGDRSGGNRYSGNRYGDRDQRPSRYGGGSDRFGRDSGFSDKRSFDDNRPSFGDRNSRSYGDRNGGRYGDRDQRQNSSRYGGSDRFGRDSGFSDKRSFDDNRFSFGETNSRSSDNSPPSSGKKQKSFDEWLNSD